jgi:hypothetical protein
VILFVFVLFVWFCLGFYENNRFGGAHTPVWGPRPATMVPKLCVVGFSCVCCFCFLFVFGFRYPREARAPQSGGQARPRWFPNYVCWFSMFFVFVCFWLCLVFRFRFDTPVWGPSPARMFPKLLFFVFPCVCLVCFGFLVFVGFGGQALPESLTSEWISLQRVWRVAIRRCPGDLV